MNLSSIDTCVFDLDGTLLDSLPYWCAAERVLFNRQGVELPDEHETHLLMFRDMEDTLSRLGMELEAAWGAMATLMDGHYADSIPPKMGAESFLKALDARGTRLCLATGSRRRHAESALARCNLSGYFSALYSTHETALRKEHSAFFPWLAGELGTSPHAMLVVEDSPIVAKNARHAGCTVLGILDNAYADEDRRALCAACHLVGMDFTDFLPLL